MKVRAYEIFKCDAGWRTFSFLKLVTDDGLVGWAEYNESFGSPGLSGAIETLMPGVLGMNPMDIELVNAVLATRSVQSRGGVARQAIGAIENALLDLKGKALGVPVYQLFGGKLRDRIPVYWSHCGSYRLRNPEICRTPAVRSYDDMTRLGAEVKAKGFNALKTNIALEVDGQLIAYRPGFVVGRGFPERNWDRFIAQSAARTVEAFRAGGGPDMGIMLDTNFHFRTEGFRRVAEGLGPARLTARARHARSAVDRADPPRFALSDRLGRDALGAARLPAVPRRLCLRHGDRRRGVERLHRIAQDRRHGRRLRGQRRAAQFLRPSCQRHQRAFLRRGAELPHHGDRHRRRAVARRHRRQAAGVRDRRLRAADGAGLGGRGQRGRAEEAPGEVIFRTARVPRAS
jgi:hypothetical protein